MYECIRRCLCDIAVLVHGYEQDNIYVTAEDHHSNLRLNAEAKWILKWTGIKRNESVCVIKTNSMHYLSSVYFVNQHLHVSDIFVVHHQEVYCVYIYIYIYTAIGTCCAF